MTRPIDTYLAEGDFVMALYCVWKPDQPAFLASLIREHGVERLYSAIRSTWIGAEFPSTDYLSWYEIWSEIQDQGDRYQVMKLEEREAFDALADNLTVYRGFQRGDGANGGERGWSWTLNRDQAVRFARRWHTGIPSVAMVVVPKYEVLAYFNERGEREIVLMPECLDEITVEQVSRDEVGA